MLLMDWLAVQFPLAKKQTLRRMVEDGRVSINGVRARRVKQDVAEGDQVVVSDRPEPVQAELAPLELIHEDADVLVVNKPAGLLTSTVPRERRPTAISIIRRYLADREPKARAGVIHRLDRDAAGLLVFSKNHAAFENLKRQFFHHTVDRIYLAVVHGKPSARSGRIDKHLVEHADGTVHVTRNVIKGEQAVTEYEVLETHDEQSLLRLKLQTGRKHQIRVHLAHLGHAIVGDSVYGEAGRNEPLLLAAVRLAFDQPRTGERLSFHIEPPKPMRKQFPRQEAEGGQ